MLSSKLIHSVTGLDAANVVKLEINKENLATSTAWVSISMP